jgi:thioredoxin reductase
MPDYENYLGAYAQHFGLTPKTAEVSQVTRVSAGFEVQESCGLAVQCRFLIVASGLFDHSVWPEIEGLSIDRGQGNPIVMHSRDWSGAKAFSNRRILIIGAGISGVSITEECARAGLQVFVSHRSKRVRLVRPRILGRDILDWFRPVEFLPRALFGSLCRRGVHPPAYDNGYSKLVKNGKITELPEVKKVEGRKVNCVDGSRHAVDVIVAATGYRYAAPFLPPQVRRMPGGHPACRNCESPDWPGLFFVGAPCASGIDSEFLRGIAGDAGRVAKEIRSRIRQAAV